MGRLMEKWNHQETLRKKKGKKDGGEQDREEKKHSLASRGRKLIGQSIKDFSFFYGAAELLIKARQKRNSATGDESERWCRQCPSLSGLRRSQHVLLPVEQRQW